MDKLKIQLIISLQYLRDKSRQSTKGSTFFYWILSIAEFIARFNQGERVNFETRDSFRMVLDDTRPIEFLNETLEVPEWRLVAKSTTDGTKDIGKEEQLAWRRSHQALRKQSYATYLLYLISP